MQTLLAPRLKSSTLRGELPNPISFVARRRRSADAQAIAQIAGPQLPLRMRCKRRSSCKSGSFRAQVSIGAFRSWRAILPCTTDAPSVFACSELCESGNLN